MRLIQLLECLTFVVAALAKAPKSPNAYYYQESIRDTVKYKSPFFMFGADTGDFTDGRNIQLRKLPNGDFVPVVDASSPVLQAQFNEGELQQVEYFYYSGSRKKPNGLAAGLREIEKYATNSTSYEIVFSKKNFKSELSFHGWSGFGPEGTDGAYLLSANAPFKGESAFFTFALCKKSGGEYQQLIFAQATTHKTITAPPGCYKTNLYATIAPPFGKNACKS